jgi:hypothetical protein
MRIYHFFMSLLLFSTSFTIAQNYNWTDFENTLKIEALPVKFPIGNNCNGSFEITCHSGKAPFLYSNSAGRSFQEKPIFENLCEGQYFIQVRDADGKLGMTLIDFRPNSSNELYFTEDEKNAIRKNTIDELLQQRELVYHNWELRREIDYKLSRHGHYFPPIITEQKNTDEFITYTYKVIMMNHFDKNTLMTEYERQKTMFNEYMLDLTYNENAGTVTVIFNAGTPKAIINKFFTFNGFTELN